MDPMRQIKDVRKEGKSYVHRLRREPRLGTRRYRDATARRVMCVDAKVFCGSV